MDSFDLTNNPFSLQEIEAYLAQMHGQPQSFGDNVALGLKNELPLAAKIGLKKYLASQAAGTDSMGTVSGGTVIGENADGTPIYQAGTATTGDLNDPLLQQYGGQSTDMNLSGGQSLADQGDIAAADSNDAVQGASGADAISGGSDAASTAGFDATAGASADTGATAATSADMADAGTDGADALSAGGVASDALPYVGLAAGSYGAYDLADNQDRSRQSGAFQGAASGAAIGAYAGPIGAVIGGAAGALYGGLISGRRSTLEVQRDDQNDLLNDPHQTDFQAYLKAQQPNGGINGSGGANSLGKVDADQDPNFVGYNSKNQWVNNKFATSRDESDLQAQDTEGADANFQILGNQYLDGASQSQREEYQKDLLNKGLWSEHQGQLTITDPDQAKQIWQSVISTPDQTSSSAVTPTVTDPANNNLMASVPGYAASIPQPGDPQYA